MIYVDGIYLGRRAVILIASTDTHVVGWYLACSEHSQSWGALLSRIAPPQVVVMTLVEIPQFCSLNFPTRGRFRS
ncbi:hypothetical protein [Flaviflexus equikiangi]|uniref:Mutator family transposase n=1 Tax=Flaviflexus equikiangi TaxID=2758573 RepID=A0ABS2TCV8_9ACTO|nr:hypothetical protein [Flaviflexus equikiangi]MBM9432486.1 hypothetical protein [Flaviflexus equikiangi]